MQDKGINSTFKKIIYESSEMVFLADDNYPYSIFYANEAFEAQLGESLSDRSLAGLGLDINAYIFKEELIISHGEKDYSFKLELPQDSGANYFLFYKGKEIRHQGAPTRRESNQFFSTCPDVLGVGRGSYLTFVNPSVQSVLGYGIEELLQVDLCPYLHPEDLTRVRHVWESHQRSQDAAIVQLRFRVKEGGYRHLDCSIQFGKDHFCVVARDVSMRVLEEANHLKQLSLRSIIPDLAKVGGWKLDVAKQQVMLDPDAAKIVSEVLGESSGQFSLFDEFWAQIDPKLSSERADTETLVGELKLGISRPLGFSAFVPEGKPQEVWGVIWDDSLGASLRAETETLRALWLESTEAMILVEPSGKVSLVNQEANLLFGFGDTNLIDHLDCLNGFLEPSHPWTAWLSTSSRVGVISRFYLNLLGEDGLQLPLEVASRKILLESKDYFVLSFRNISDKISLEKKVEASGDFLINLTEQVPGGLYQLVLNSEGQMRFSFVSKGIGSVLGLSQEDIHQLTDISSVIAKVHPQDLSQVVMSSVASARKMEPWQCQFRVKTDTAHSEYRWVLGAARPQVLETGEMVWYGYLTDISKQKEFEAKLDEARLAAEKATQVKSDFLSMISHELRTPLNAISGSVYTLTQDEPSESQQSALSTINFAVDNLIIMINDLLDFQKIEAGKLSIETSPVNLKALMEQVVQGLSFHAKDSQNQLSLYLDPELDLEVKADKTRLSQVMNNLTTNALKFTHQGKVAVNVEMLEQIRDHIRVRFEVRDTGVGIAAEHQELIFNDFDQVKPTFNTKYGGTGLGLSITRKLLKLMGGQIQLESQVGVGSRFFFELDLEIVQGQSVGSPVSVYTEAAQPPLHLLMAEDNEVNALVLGKIIRKWGYTFDRAHNGKEAVEAARTASYDCVLMDIQMPEMDGFEATTEIKKFSDTPIIALTAAAKLEILGRIDDCGFDGFVAKPIDAGELLKKVKEVCVSRAYKA